MELKTKIVTEVETLKSPVIAKTDVPAILTKNKANIKGKVYCLEEL